MLALTSILPASPHSFSVGPPQTVLSITESRSAVNRNSGESRTSTASTLKKNFSVPPFLREYSLRLAAAVVKLVKYQTMYSLSTGARLDSGTLDGEVANYFASAIKWVATRNSPLAMESPKKEREEQKDKSAQGESTDIEETTDECSSSSYMSTSHSEEEEGDDLRRISQVESKRPKCIKKPIWLSSLASEAAMYNYDRTCDWKSTIMKTGLVSKGNLMRGVVDKEGLNEYITNTYECILIPVHCRKAEHFSLLVWYCQDPKSIYHYDSIRMPVSHYDPDLEDLNYNRAVLHWKFFRDLGFTLPEWIHCPEWCPQQLSDWECGHHLVVYVIILSWKYMIHRGKIYPIQERDIFKEKFEQTALKRMWEEQAHVCAEALI